MSWIYFVLHSNFERVPLAGEYLVDCWHRGPSTRTTRPADWVRT